MIRLAAKVFTGVLLGNLLSFGSIRGFPESLESIQQKRESEVLKLPSAGNIENYLKRLTEEPHVAGTEGSRRVATYIRDLLASWGLSAEFETFEVLLPQPKTVHLEMLEPHYYRFDLREPSIPSDPDTSDANQLPAFNAYGADGDVSGELVYVNYGLPEDFKELERLGIDVKGRIVIARYGRSWRGIKVKLAQQHGALGCILYSDPRDDGYWSGRPYPDGPMRPWFGLQRGSVMDMPVYTGDPLTPGWPSLPEAKRSSLDEAVVLPRIPVLPMSYGHAKVLLENLGGPVAPESWRGALPITYQVGPGPARVRIRVVSDWSNRTIYNVIAQIRGHKWPNEWIIFGNHHDAWANGARDPSSGAASLLEMARSLAELRRRGWTPGRTIVISFWDAEEYGLIGSTEWVEKHIDELRKNAAVYINTDSNTAGTLGASGSPTLEAFFKEIMEQLADPKSGKTLLAAALAELKGRREQQKDSEPTEFRFSALGAGSDYVAFVHHAGIASIYLAFRAPDLGGTYHSIYDTFAWYSRFADPDFRYCQALSRFLSVMALRLADAPLLPLRFIELTRYLKENLEDLKKNHSDAFAEEPATKLAGALAALERAAAEYEAAYEAWRAAPANNKNDRDLAQINQLLMSVERSFASGPGLPSRSWYRNRLYAPGLLLGYGAITLPGIREALEANNQNLLQTELEQLTNQISRVTADIETATRLLQQLTGASSN